MPVNLTPNQTLARNPIHGARIVSAGFRQAKSPSPRDRARAIQQITEQQIGDGPRGWFRRVLDRIEYDEALRLALVCLLTMGAFVVIFAGLFL